MSTHRKVAGRPGGPTSQRKSERVPPVYVSEKDFKRYEALAAQKDMQWSEFGRKAFEFYAEHGDKDFNAPEPISETAVVVDLDSELHALLSEFARRRGIKNLADYIEHLARRSIEVKADTFYKFFYDDAESTAEALAVDLARRRAPRSESGGGRFGSEDELVEEARGGRRNPLLKGEDEHAAKALSKHAARTGSAADMVQSHRLPGEDDAVAAAGRARVKKAQNTNPSQQDTPNSKVA